MTTRQLVYAVEAARLGSFNNAAKKLFVSQPSLSTAIRELESEIGFRLFERSHSGIRRTAQGCVFLERARRAVEALGDIERDYVQDADPVSRLSVVTVQSSIVPLAFAMFAAEAEQKSMRLRLSSKLAQTSEVVEAIRSGEYEVGLIYTTSRQEKVWLSIWDGNGLCAVEIFKTRLYMILSANDPLAVRESLSFADLAGHTFAYSGDGGIEVFSNLTDYSYWDFNLEQHRCYVDVQDNLQLNQLLLHSRSFSIGHKAPQTESYAGLAYVPAQMDETAKMYALRNRNKPETPELSRFLSVLINVAKQVIG